MDVSREEQLSKKPMLSTKKKDKDAHLVVTRHDTVTVAVTVVTPGWRQGWASRVDAPFALRHRHGSRSRTRGFEVRGRTGEGSTTVRRGVQVLLRASEGLHLICRPTQLTDKQLKHRPKASHLQNSILSFKRSALTDIPVEVLPREAECLHLTSRPIKFKCANSQNHT